MSHQSANFGGGESWAANLWKSLKVESTLKIQIILLSCMVVQINKQKNYIYKQS